MTNKIVVVDVGCRWGFADEFINSPDVFQVYGFDPDPDECARLNKKYASHSVTAIPIGLSATPGEHILYLTQDPACSSLYQPDPYLTANYPAFHCEVEIGQTVIETTTLDHWAKATAIDYIDHLKIDTQGSELDILKGATQILETVRSVQIEVEFNPMYIGQCLFHEVDAFMRRHGFILWKFSEMTHYSRNTKPGRPIHSCDIRYDNYHHDRYKVYSGQLFWANAHYVKSDVLSEQVTDEQRKKDCTLFPAIGMPDVIGLDCQWDETVLKTFSDNSRLAEHLDNRYQQAEAALAALHHSKSWRLTAPLRMISHTAKTILRKIKRLS